MDWAIQDQAALPTVGVAPLINEFGMVPAPSVAVGVAPSHLLEVRTDVQAAVAIAPAGTNVIRVWGSGATDNDAGKTTPGNANGEADFVRSTVRTALSLGDLTNPVTLTSAAFAACPAGTYTSKLLRVWFNIPNRIGTLDTMTLRYNIGAGEVVIYTHPGATFVNHNDGTFTFDISALTVAQCQALVLSANYLAAVVAAPEAVINLDAWAIDLAGSF